MTEANDEPDDLKELLAPPSERETPGLRDAILRRTQKRLALRKWTRRTLQTACIAALFALGVGVGVWVVPRERETVIVPAPAPQPEAAAAPVPVFIPLPVPLPSGTAEPPKPARSAKALELEAEQADGARSAALYRQAGDAYLDAEQDYANAARCYRLFLARGGDAALTPATGDSWLLTSLKNAAFKEKVNATPTNG
jgi:hypothetical protein